MAGEILHLLPSDVSFSQEALHDAGLWDLQMPRSCCDGEDGVSERHVPLVSEVPDMALYNA